MARQLFGTDGIRGTANVGSMSAEMVLKVGRAAGKIFQREERRHTILIGKDTRQSGYMIENALTAGLCSMGVNVMLVGPLPTPGVSYIMRSLRCDAAIMISASHNPFEDNGIKFFGPDGFKLPDEVEEEIESLVFGDGMNGVAVTGAEIGRAKRIDDAQGRYIEFAKATFPKGMRLDGLRIVLDCANGAAYRVGPNALSELGAEIIPLGVTPDGHNINQNCGSVYPENMRATVIREKADLGIAFDGDGDRIAIADSDGRLLDGNAILAMLGVDMITRGELPQKTVVTTIMANGGLERALRPYGGTIVRTKVGDRYVVETMREKGLALGGESSGHIVMLEHNTTGDALLTGLRVLATMIRNDAPLSQLGAIYQPMPEAHEKVPLNGKPAPSQSVLDGIREAFEKRIADRGRVVMRPSGTEPIIRVMVQHEDAGQAKSLAAALAQQVRDL